MDVFSVIVGHGVCDESNLMLGLFATPTILA